MPKIKIYSLSTTYPATFSSTTPQFVHTLNKELVKLGFEITAIVPHSKGSLTKERKDSVFIKRFKYLPENYEIKSGALVDTINSGFLGSIKVFLLCFNFFISTFFECLKEKPDIIHAHWAFPAGFIAVVMSAIFKKKSIITIHGGFGLFNKFNFLKKIIIYTLSKTQLIIANSNFTKNKLLQLNIESQKITRIFASPSFMNDNTDKDSLANLRKTFTDPSTKIILFIGRLVELKGVEYLLRSVLEIKRAKIHLLIVGNGPLFGKLRDITKSLGIQNKVTFTGGLFGEKLERVRKISDIFVLPSIVDSMGDTETLGLVVVESMNSGLPVIASSVGGIVDIVENEVNGLLVNPKDPKAIANAVERLLLDEELATKVLKNSQKTVKQFLPENIAKQHEEVYRQVLGRN